MAAIYRKMYGKKWALACFIVIAVSLLAAYAAFAQGRTQTMKFKKIMHFTQGHRIEAGDKSGHFIMVGENQGLAIFENGEIAADKGWFLWDEISSDVKEKGSGYGYHVLTFEDGSTITTKFEGAHSWSKKAGKYSHEEKGTVTFTGGTGRFKGIKGNGTYKGRRIAPETDNCYDFDITYTLP